ncbi:hypothetical protein SDC9_185690 [bioreactor metagenome]|uniref:Uncharacterized protein n=1 Tax=bioreactor metagenome TaxID=1076179 RepID=A0A645HHV2_9ZZZZ
MIKIGYQLFFSKPESSEIMPTLEIIFECMFPFRQRQGQLVLRGGNQLIRTPATCCRSRDGAGHVYTVNFQMETAGTGACKQDIHFIVTRIHHIYSIEQPFSRIRIADVTTAVSFYFNGGTSGITIIPTVIIITGVIARICIMEGISFTTDIEVCRSKFIRFSRSKVMRPSERKGIGYLYLNFLLDVTYFVNNLGYTGTNCCDFTLFIDDSNILIFRTP